MKDKTTVTVTEIKTVPELSFQPFNRITSRNNVYK